MDRWQKKKYREPNGIFKYLPSLVIKSSEDLKSNKDEVSFQSQKSAQINEVLTLVLGCSVRDGRPSHGHRWRVDWDTLSGGQLDRMFCELGKYAAPFAL